MNARLRSAFERELRAAREEAAAARIEVAFRHLERAHVIGQRDTAAHVVSHWRMLLLGASVGRWREVAGQVSRIVAAALFSRIWVPAGNTGRAHVRAWKSMPVPEDLVNLLKRRS